MFAKKLYRVGSAREMQALAQEAVAGMPSGTVLLLYGELGAGKTTFVQGLAQALAIKEAVTSPTFTIAGEYEIPGDGVLKTLSHVDLYRLKGNSAAKDPMVAEILMHTNAPGMLTVIEWADRLGAQAIEGAWKITFSHGVKEGERLVDIVQV